MAPIRCCFDQTAVWHSDAARGPSTPSFDHLVGAGEHDRWNLETNRPRGLDVDHQRESGRSFNWQISRLGSLENAIDVYRCTLVHVGQTGAVSHQPPGAWKQSEEADRG